MMTPSIRRGWRLATMLLWASAVGLVSPAHAGVPVVRVQQGQLAGVADSGGSHFLGIPFAAPPVGTLRWRPAQPPAAWTGVRDASQAGAACAQPLSPYGPQSGSEDCLYLNVWVPPGTAADASLPVLVWLHGGAFIAGSGGDFDASALAAAGPMIVVTVNYRLGALGFLAHPALGRETRDGASGNYGLTDQQAALRWVQHNIAAFGGDAGRVALAGQSAGGLSVLSQLASPRAAGLFQRAIVQSGTYRLAWASLRDAERAGRNLADTLGCRVRVADCLRAVPVDTLLAAQIGSGSTADVALSWGPNAGAGVLPEQPLSRFADGRFNRVPVLIGTAHDEGRLFTAMEFDEQGAPLTAEGYAAAVETLVGGIAAPLVLREYPLTAYSSPDLAYAAVFGDSGLSCQGQIIEEILSAQVPTQVYELSDADAGTVYLPVWSFPYGATHTSDVPYLFPAVKGHQYPLGPKPFTPESAQLATTMRTLWGRFAADGRAAGAGVPEWPLYSRRAPQVLTLQTPAPLVQQGFAQSHHCTFWKPLLWLGAALPTWLTGAAM